MNKKAFTLAETLIVLVILGIVASITIPAVVRNQIEAQNRTRIKKAMTVYDMALNKMVVENNLKSNDALYSSDPSDKIAFAPQDNCTRTSAYFKISRTLNDDNGTNCRFCSSDNVCWDISNILKPIIGIGEEGITNENSTNRYRMFAHFGDNGELRVDDVAYEQNHDYLTDDEKEEIVALYNFVNNKKSTGGGEEKPKSFLDDCDKIDDAHYICDGTPFVPKTGDGSCINITYGPLAGTQSCGTDKTVWVPENPIGWKVYGADATSDENCATSTYEWCKDDGDYYNAAKRYCESKGTHLATVGELISLGYTDGDFWAAEESASDGAYFLSIGDVINITKDFNFDVVCVGN